MNRTPIILLILVLSIVLYSCDESKIYMKYNFFSREEVEDIYINTDSVMHFQKEISKCITYEEFKGINKDYSEVDTVLFKYDNIDTVKCRSYSIFYINDRSDGLAISSETESGILTRLNPIDNCYVTGVSYGFFKQKTSGNILTTKTIGFAIEDNYEFKYKADLTEGGLNIDNSFFVTSRETFFLNNQQIDNCLHVKFFNSILVEQAVIVYSNKYGFLKIKDTNHEITRIL